jgi:gluconolactonase
LIESETGHHMTNVAFGGPGNKTLYITEADTGTIQSVEMPIPGKVMYSHH